MTAADEVNAEVGQIALELNDLLTQIVGISTQVEELGTRVLVLKTHNQDVMIAAGNLVNSIPKDLRSVLNKLMVAHQSLEQFKA